MRDYACGLTRDLSVLKNQPHNVQSRQSPLIPAIPLARAINSC